MVVTLLNTLNNYAKYYKETGNKAVLPAIDRIKAKIEKESGKKIKVVEENGIAKYSL